jgi:hypothetical protein
MFRGVEHGEFAGDRGIGGYETTVDLLEHAVLHARCKKYTVANLEKLFKRNHRGCWPEDAV